LDREGRSDEGIVGAAALGVVREVAAVLAGAKEEEGVGEQLCEVGATASFEVETGK
jgi:hypothetical protein